MDKKGEISLYRAKLDKSLASPELTDHEALKTLVRDQMVQSRTGGSEDCSENLLERRTADVSNFLDMLRSASSSGNEGSKLDEPPSGEWKVKDNNQEYRVMYRPGLQGTPFHTLLVEGYVDGPVDACLCIGWESALYRKCVKKLTKKGPWWPQVIMPPFKIAICKCLKRVRIGEQISLVRVKVAWPLQAREVVIHYVLFEYLKEGIVIVLMNTVPDLEAIDIDTHGYTKDGIPEAQDVVRAELVGGFALQKVTSTRSYFRTIATVDLKIDFVPPALINFISRQLIGSGFKLYQKAVTALYKDDDEYIRALEDPFYVRMRESIYATNVEHQITEGKESIDEDHDDDADESLPKRAEATATEDSNEIEEHESKEAGYPIDDGDEIRSAETRVEEDIDEPTEQLQNVGEGTIGQSSASSAIRFAEKGCIAVSPKVKQALETLETAIAMVRKSEFNALVRPSPAPTAALTNEENSDLEKGAEEKNPNSTKQDNEQSPPYADDPKTGPSCSDARHSSSSVAREFNYRKVAPASSPEPFVSTPTQVRSENGNGNVDEAVGMDRIRDDDDEDEDKVASREVVDGNEEGMKKKKQRRFALTGIRLQGGKKKKQQQQQQRRGLCCFAPGPGSVK